MAQNYFTSNAPSLNQGYHVAINNYSSADLYGNATIKRMTLWKDCIKTGMETLLK
jgi:hypothetical protein